MMRETPTFPDRGLFIGGVWRPPAAGAQLPVENPSNGAVVGEIAEASAADIDDAVGAARAALEGPWGAMAPADRGRLLAAIGRAIAERADWLAELESMDVGKPIGEARADARALARYFEFYAGAADKVHGETLPYLPGYTVFTQREPFGVTAHIIPWNYPMQILGRSVVAALTMGNAVVLKPAEQASLTSLAVAGIAQSCRASRRCPECRHRIRRGCRPCACCTSGHRSSVLYRLDARGRVGTSGRRGECRSGYAGTRRQIPAGAVR